MNVFILGSPLDTARKLDKKRLNNQINECTIILRALLGESKAWINHPAVLSYGVDNAINIVTSDDLKRAHRNTTYLRYYRTCLRCYKDGDVLGAIWADGEALKCTPEFHTPEFIDQMKRRLYTKDKQYYAEFAELGESNQNWFCVDGVIRVYENGKRVK